MLALFVLLCATIAVGQEYDPNSRIQRPPGKGPTYVMVAAGGGNLADGDQVRPGYSITMVFRPHRAADFYNGLYAWNTALVLQVDKQGGGPAGILSGDMVLRHYLSDMRPFAGGRSVFFGLGAGISHVDWTTPASNGQAGSSGSADGFSFLTELGMEWNLDPALVLVGKGQYRLYNRGGHDHSGWSVHLGAGIPFPF